MKIVLIMNTSISFCSNKVKLMDDEIELGLFNGYGEIVRAALLMTEYFNVNPINVSPARCISKSCVFPDLSQKPVISEYLSACENFSELARNCVQGLQNLITTDTLIEGKKIIPFKLNQFTRSNLERAEQEFGLSEAEITRLGVLAYVYTDFEIRYRKYKGESFSSVEIPMHFYVKLGEDKTFNQFMPLLIDETLRVISNN